MKINIYNFNLLKNFHFTKKELQKTLGSVFFDDALSINIVFVASEEMRELNEGYRGVDKVTDVLSFGPYEGLGEVYISHEFLQEKKSDFSKEILRTIVHGIVHLQGYDHVGYFDENNMKEEMYILQEEYLKKIYDILGQ